MNRYTLELENDQLLNIIPLVKFLKENESKDIYIVVNQESHCLRFCGVYDILDLFTFTSVKILTSNAVEYHDKYQIILNWSYWLYKSKEFVPTDYTWNQTKTFGCFYGRINAARIGIVGHLAYYYNDKSLLQLKSNFETEDARKLVEIQKLFSWDIFSITKFDFLLQNKSQYYQSIPAYNYQTGEYNYNSELNELYKNIFIDIVVEATAFGNTFYPTEKIARAILCKKPFIVMSSRYYLAYLKQLGFKTFNEFWSEDYDSYDGKDRYYAILKLLDQLALLSMYELVELNTKLQQIIEHNYKLLVSQQYNKKITRIIPYYE